MEQHSFGFWLRLQRKALDLTREELAERVGYSAATIRKIEDEERHPSAQVVERLAEVFRIPQNERTDFLRFARGDWSSVPVDTEGDQPWRASGKSPRSNIPATTTSLIAREKEIADVRKYLEQDDIRLVTLIGPPGIGKTRLSIESARTALPDFPDGAFFVALAPLDNPGLIAQTIAQSLGFVGATNLSVMEQLTQGIGDRHILIVLDNCEHLIEDVARLALDLLSACPRLSFLATSREVLRIPGEWLYAVPAFEVPDENLLEDVKTAYTFPALNLFAERARAVQTEFALSVENLTTVSAICKKLDGLPLAIELIAARTRSMSPQVLLERLDNQFILTADGMRAVSARQKTLNGAIHWSYKLLSEEEQNLFVYLSVFSGGFTMEAAETIFADRFGGTSIANLVTSLLDKSLLQRAVGARAEIRFSMLVTIREFALNHLRNMGRETEARDRYLAYFLTLAEGVDGPVHGPDQLEWINKLEAEHDNFRTAFEWSLSANQTENAVRLFNSVHWAWYVRCHYSELSEWFEEIINLPDIEQFPLQRARALTNAGSMEWLQGKFAEARSYLTQSKAICMELGLEGEADLAWALTWLAQVRRMEGTELAEAAGLAKDGLQFHQKWGNKIGEAFCALILGAIQTEKLPSTQQTLATQTVEHSLELFNQLGDSWGISRVSGYLGVQAFNAGDLEKAQTYFEQQLFLDEKLDFKEGIAAALSGLANVHRVRGDFIQARQTFQKSIQIAQEIASDFSFSLYGLSMTALAENDYASALKLFKELFDHERKQYRQIIACDFLMGLSAVSAGLDQPERSAKLYGAGQTIMNITDYKYSPYDRAEFERHIQLARQRLAESFEPFVQAGRAMTMEQAIAYALEK